MCQVTPSIFGIYFIITGSLCGDILYEEVEAGRVTETAATAVGKAIREASRVRDDFAKVSLTVPPALFLEIINILVRRKHLKSPRKGRTKFRCFLIEN